MKSCHFKEKYNFHQSHLGRKYAPHFVEWIYTTHVQEMSYI